MRLDGRRESDNIEDRRAESDGSGGEGGGFGIPFPSGGGNAFGGGGIVGFIVIVGLALFFGVDPRVLLGGGFGFPQSGEPRQIQTPRTQNAASSSADEESLKHFVSVVLADTEDTWGAIFPKETGRAYVRPKLVLFRGGIKSACGHALAQTGPFYCPNDRKVYIDLSFYEELKQRFHAPGEFAEAYVIAHEVGHHVQNLLGTLGKAQEAQSAAGQTQRNQIQVRVELQADCYAGVWAKATDKLNNTLEPGDIDQAIRAAEAIGDDAIQKRARGYVVPDSFTHGSSEQRSRWFQRGYNGGSISSCDTFTAASL